MLNKLRNTIKNSCQIEQLAQESRRHEARELQLQRHDTQVHRGEEVRGQPEAQTRQVAKCNENPKICEKRVSPDEPHPPYHFHLVRPVAQPFVHLNFDASHDTLRWALTLGVQLREGGPDETTADRPGGVGQVTGVNRDQGWESLGQCQMGTSACLAPPALSPPLPLVVTLSCLVASEAKEAFCPAASCTPQQPAY